MKYQLHYMLREKPDFVPAALVLGSSWHEAVANWLEGASEDAALDRQLAAAIERRLREESRAPVLFDDEEENEQRFIAKALEMFQSFGQAGRPAVWELKTAKKKRSKDQSEFDPQPPRGEAGRLSRARAASAYRDEGQDSGSSDREDLERSHYDEAEFIGTVFSVHRAIDAGIAHPIRGRQCRTCQYASSCRT